MDRVTKVLKESRTKPKSQHIILISYIDRQLFFPCVESGDNEPPYRADLIWPMKGRPLKTTKIICWLR